MITLPLNPSLNQEFTIGGTTYKFDGVAWTSFSAGNIAWSDISGSVYANSTLAAELNAKLNTVKMNGGNLTPLDDANETATGQLNTLISGNLMSNLVGIEVGITYSITQITINSNVYSPNVIPVAGVGTFDIASNGDWSFMPVTDYEGPVPVVTYNILSSDGKTNTSTLTISAIVSGPPTSPNFDLGGTPETSSNFNL